MRPAHRTEDVLRLVDARWGAPCSGCSAALGGHGIVLSLLMGFGDACRCVDCLARATGRPREAFLEEAVRRVRPLDCYRAGWEHADRRLDAEGAETGARPPRLAGEDAAPGRSPAPDAPRAHDASAETPEADAEFDAGDMSCGDLALRLRIEMNRLEPGAVLHLTSQDVAAPEDLPAWCQLTGHRLLESEHPHYWIERKHPESPQSP